MGGKPKPKIGWGADHGERQERWLWESCTWYGAACPAACSRSAPTHGTFPSLYPGPARAGGRKVPEGCGRTVVPAQKQAQPGRGSSLSAFHLLQEGGPEALCQVRRGLCSSKKQGKKEQCVFPVGKHSLGAGGPAGSPLAPSAAVPKTPAWPKPPSQQGGASSSTGHPATTTKSHWLHGVWI